MKLGIGSFLCACFWLILGLLLAIQYSRHGYVTLKEGTVVYGVQAIAIFFSLIFVGIVSLIFWVKTRFFPKNKGNQ